MRAWALIVSLLAVYTPSFAQERVESSSFPFRWGVRVVQDGTHLLNSGETWARNGFVVSRRSRRFSVNAEAFRQRLGTREDMGLAADLYKTLWRGGYVNARYQMSTLMTALPDHDVLIEFYQAAGAWEFSAGGRRMMFAETDVDFLLASVVRYQGPWYFRLRGTMLRRSEGLEGSARAYFRRYTEEVVSDAAGFREVFLGYGREVLLVHPSRPDLVNHAFSAGARIQVFPIDPLGASLGISGSLGRTPWYAIHFGIIVRFRD